MDLASRLRYKIVITVIDNVATRTPENINNSLVTGDIEVVVNEIIVESAAEMLPIIVNCDQEAPEETRLKYRFLF